MTPRQRRNHYEALGKAASAPRKSWLGKCILLTGIQSGWIKSLLTTWGEGVGGKTAPRLPRGHACWNVLKGRNWSDKALERFTVALNQAREEGFRGQQAMNRAHSILWPQSPASVIDEALHSDDVDFVEQCVLQALDINDPVYVVGLQYYTTQKKNLRHNPGTAGDCAMADTRKGQRASEVVFTDFQSKGVPVSESTFGKRGIMFLIFCAVFCVWY